MPRAAITLCGLLLLTGLVYVRSLGATFVYEDWLVGFGNSTPRSLLLGIVHLDAKSLARVGYAFCTWLGSGAVWPFHALNLTGHLLNGTLLYWLFQRMQIGRAIALTGVYIFLLHPLSSESVLYAENATEILSTMGVLLACVAALSSSRWRWLGIGLGCLAAYAGKQSGITALPLVVLVAMYKYRTRLSLMWALAGLGAVGVLVRVAWHTGQAITPEVETAFSGGQFLSWQATAVWRYLLMVPTLVGQSVDHDFEVVAAPVQYLALAGIVTLAVGLTYLWLRRHALWADRRYDLLIFGLLWAGVDLTPRFLMRITEAINEHQMYRPMIGFSLAAAQGLLLLCPSLMDPFIPKAVSISPVSEGV